MLLVELEIFAKAFLIIQKENGKNRELVEKETQMSLNIWKDVH